MRSFYDRPWDSQPQEVARPDDRWLQRGLVYASVPSMGTWDAVNGGFGVLSGTKEQIKDYGKARGFGSTFGAGTSDKHTSTLTANGVRRTYIIRLLINGTGGGTFGRVFDKITGGAQSELLMCSGSNLEYQRARAPTTTAYAWARADNIAIGITHFAICANGT